jgi:hypothetical protein
LVDRSSAGMLRGPMAAARDAAAAHIATLLEDSL